MCGDKKHSVPSKCTTSQDFQICLKGRNFGPLFSLGCPDTLIITWYRTSSYRQRGALAVPGVQGLCEVMSLCLLVNVTPLLM